MQIRSTVKEPEVPEDIKIAKKVRDATATISGLSIEAQIQKQQIKHLGERLNSLDGLAKTMIEEIKMLRDLHAKNLSKMLGGGPTA